MAIEDAVCIARLLPSSTTTDAVQERLKMLEEIRYKRAEYVRDETRQNSLGENERPSSMLCLVNSFTVTLLTDPRHVPHDAVLLQA